MDNKRKILILTLGVGKIEEDSPGYQCTKYVMKSEADSSPKTANFVAEPLIESYKPDDIYILGTIKSIWHQLYATLITPNNDDKSYEGDPGYDALVKLEKEGDHTTDYDSLRAAEKQITQIFSGITDWYRYSDYDKDHRPEIHILLTQYGINTGELKNNYSVLKSIENNLKQDISYEIAFDITHSFRSLPLYNLIILNYIRNITQYDISISHVYYGNVELNRELGHAPIVDLQDLVRILDLTNGVTEFKNTGNAVSIVGLMGESDPDFTECLKQFDLATQLNAFDKIKDILQQLDKMVLEETDDARYTGVREMIATVLKDKFYESDEKNAVSLCAIDDVDLKYMLTMWFFNQNRMGLGLATGLEALRDINTPKFMAARGYADGERKYRENAETYFIMIAQKLTEKEEKSKLEQAVEALGTNLREYKQIRNMFAHSLNSQKDMDLNDVRDKIEEFKEQLSQVKEMSVRYPKQYEELFSKDKKTGAEKTADTTNCRIVIDCRGNGNYKNYLKSGTGKQYDVYCLDETVRNDIFRYIKTKNYPAAEKACRLSKYLKSQLAQDQFDSYQQIQIIMKNFEKDAIYSEDIYYIFRAFLENMAADDSQIVLYCEETKGTGIKPCSKLRIPISMDDMETDMKEQDIDYSDQPLRRV